MNNRYISPYTQGGGFNQAHPYFQRQQGAMGPPRPGSLAHVTPYRLIRRGYEPIPPLEMQNKYQGLPYREYLDPWRSDFNDPKYIHFRR